MANIDKIQVGSTTYDIASSASATNTFTSSDVADGSATAWTTVAALASGETTSSILGKISQMFKNIRFLYKKLGTTDISSAGTDVTTAISNIYTKTNAISGVYPVVGTQTAATGTWTGVINAPALYDGMIIAYYLPFAGSGNATLNLTLSGGGTTGAINCYYQGNSRLTTHFGAGSTILLTYWSAGAIKVGATATTDNRWTADSSYNTNTTYAAATTAANGLMTSTDKTKLDSVAASANNYSHPTYTSYASALRKFTTDTSGHVSATAAVAKSDITGLGIPAQDTTYAAATTAAAGLMTAAMVTKLNGIATGANAYTHPTYTSAASGLYKVAVDGTGHVSGATAVAKADITGLGIPASDTTYAAFTSAAAGLVPAASSGTTNYATSGYVLTGAGWKAGTKYNTDNNTTYAAVTTAANGLMTSTDKTKLDSVAASANNYTHPTYTSAASGFRKFTVDATGHVSATAAVTKSDITALGIPESDTNTTYAAFTSAAAGLVPAASSGTTNYATSGYVLTGAGWKAGTKYNTNTTYGAATTAANGLMTSAMVTKLNGIATGANAYTHPSYTSYASGLRKFTVDASGHVSATAAVAKADITDLGIPAQDTTYAAFTSAATGLVPAASSGTTNYATSGYVLTGAGWKAGTKYNTDTNTTYGAATSAAQGLTKASYVSGTTLVVF